MTSLLLLTAAHAGTAVWLSGSPDPSQTPGDTAVTVDDIAGPDPFDESDLAAARALVEALAASRPLLDEFDGELAIIQRIDRALAPITVLRPTDVDPMWQALLLQGLAVHRYFPDPTAEEAQSAGVSSTFANRAENRGWANAIALAPDRLPTVRDLPDDAARLAYQEQRARALLVPDSVLTISHLPDTAIMRIDGKVQVSGANRVALVPGHHRISIEHGDTVHQRLQIIAMPGEPIEAAYLADTTAFGPVSLALADAQGAVSLSPAVVARAESLDGPVKLVVPQKRGVKVFLIDGTAAFPNDLSSSLMSGKNGPVLRVGLGGGWVYDGDYLLQNNADGAPEDTATVNAGTPVVHFSGQLPLGDTPLHASAGVDLLVPMGDFHTLPTGEQEVRTRAFPHLAIGAGPAALTVGWWTPWHLGVGAQATVPIQLAWSVMGGFTQGVGIPRARDTGPDFEPATARFGWIGASYTFGD